VHVNKVSRVRTIDRVAKELGEDVDFLFEVAIEMEPEDGVIWAQGLEDESVVAFTDFAVDSLVELIKIRRIVPQIHYPSAVSLHRVEAFPGRVRPEVFPLPGLWRERAWCGRGSARVQLTARTCVDLGSVHVQISLARSFDQISQLSP
jgi:hypothetical protein